MSDEQKEESIAPYVGPERRRGRPRLEQQGSTVSAWLRPSEHDRLIRLANLREQSVSSLVRELLILRLR